MTRLELHADFDRDGVLTGSAAERTARLSRPGLVVVPNLDRDQRMLPGTVGDTERPRPDFDAATAFSRDDELVPVHIHVPAGGGPGPDEELVARVPGLMHTRVRLSDTTGGIVPHRPGRPETYVLPPVPASGVLRLTLQVRTVAGASFGQLSTLDTGYTASDVVDHRFELLVGFERADGSFVEEDRGHVSVAPFVLDDGLAPATRVYVASVPDNAPSVADLRRAARAAGVPVVEVPEAVNQGDAWLQDQFQHAHLEGPDGFRALVVHLPRMASNTAADPGVRNLRAFVDSHFRSRDLGVYDGLWERVLPVSTAGGGVLRLDPGQLWEWVATVGRIEAVVPLVLQVASLVGKATVTFTEDWIETVRVLPDNLRAVDHAAERAKAEATSVRRREEIDALVADLHRSAADATRGIGVRGSGDRTRVTLPVAGSSVELSAAVARRVTDRAVQMHGSAVYGGNLESTPPVPDAPLGKIVLGNRRSDRGESMDPDLLRLLVAQRRQPIVEIDTTWLDVGHVDEMLAVVPHRTSGFSVLHASSAMAVALLREATGLYQSGLSIEHPDRDLRRPSGVLPRLMTDGSHPVTRLFRGKMWKHREGSGRPGDRATDVAPPRIFRRLAFEFGDSDSFNAHPVGFVPGPGERFYRADITPAEVLWCEADQHGTSTQDVLDKAVLEPSRELLNRELGVPVLPIPVLWDQVPDLSEYAEGKARTPTSSFSPDCANLQLLNGHLVVPKPYGPRMRASDAVTAVRAVMEGVAGLEAARARVGPRLVAQRRMAQETYWVQRRDGAVNLSPSGIVRRSYGGLRDLDDLADVFRDSFPGESRAQVTRRLSRANGGLVDGRGLLRREFSRVVVRDGMVDLFELFIAAVVDQLGLTLHFVDSWYYHLHLGQIHCGTNVLRRPSRAGRPHVWDVADWEGFRSQTMTFEDEPVPVR